MREFPFWGWGKGGGGKFCLQAESVFLFIKVACTKKERDDD